LILSINIKKIFTILLLTAFITSQIVFVQCQRIDRHVISSELSPDNYPIRFKFEYSTEDPWVISWVKLRSIDKALTCTWKWKDPDRNIYWEESIEISGDKKTEVIFSYFALEEDVFKKPGRWMVQFYANDKYMFYDYFSIVLPKNVTTTTIPEPSTSEKITFIEGKTIPEKGVNLYPGDYVTFILSIKNAGTAPAEKVELIPAEVPDGIELVEATPPSDIGIGEIKDFNLKFLCQKAGNYDVQVNGFESSNFVESINIEIVVSNSLASFLPFLIAPLSIVIIILLVIFYKKRKRIPEEISETTDPYF
jgi:uncharacterized repeat protein (TIGR01451 family)